MPCPDPSWTYPELDQLKTKASICYRLLRYMKSARFGFRHEIHSVRHALAILGDREARRWRAMATPTYSSSGCSPGSRLMLEIPMGEIAEKIPLDYETKALPRERTVCCDPSTS
jgi:hypothetical protein